MDISPKTLREVEFREKFRGYHPEDVDMFLERVAVGIEALQVQLRQATERAAHAEQLAAEAGTTDEALSRTLLLAQRTADTAVEEAREQAARIVATAESQARIILEEASQRAQRVAEESQAALRAELANLEALRDQLRIDVEVLQQWVEEHRGALSTALTSLVRQLDKGMKLKSAAPQVGDVEIPPEPSIETPEAPTAEALARADDDGMAPPADEAGEGVAADDEAGDAELGAADGPGRAEIVAEADDEPVEQQATADEPGADDVDSEHGGGDGGQAVEAQEDEDDPFMAELRRAVTDTEPLGPRDEVEAGEQPDAPATSLHDDLEASRRFGSRLRKRR